MPVEIKAIGGFSEIGRNMAAIKVDDEVVICDMGLHIPNYIRATEEERENIVKVSESYLRKKGAIPNDNVMKNWRDKVVAIIPSHAHLDHVGAVPYMAQKYDCPIISGPFTMNVLKHICADENIKLKNKFIDLNPNSSYQLTDNIKVEFINMTHSIPQTMMIALHTKYGIFVYGNDFKMDYTPTLGQKPNFAAIERIAKKGVKCAIIDVINAHEDKKTPSEKIAKEMLNDVLLNINADDNLIIVTTFSSHIARLKAIVECAKKIKRKVVFMGRSLAKYALSAKEAQVIDFGGDVEICKYPNQVKKMLKQVEKEGREKYLLVVTGHQGEPKAMLSKLADEKLPFRFKQNDHVVFACEVIPSSINKKHREVLEKKLKKFGLSIFKDIHVSGHGAREDLRDLITRMKPEHILPAHGAEMMVNAFLTLGKELGYKSGKNIHILSPGQSHTF